MLSLRLLPAALLAGFVAATPLVGKSVALEERQFGCQGNTTHFCDNGGGLCGCYPIPSDCEAIYTVQPGDNCIDLSAKFSNFTLSILYYWNPYISRACSLQAYAPLCINTPWYTFSPPVQPNAGTVQDDSVPTNQPVPIAPLTTPNCTTYELAGNGFTIDAFKRQNGITDEQFYEWNPYVNQSNPVTWANYWYCVGASS